jgi:hypothetical protein
MLSLKEREILASATAEHKRLQAAMVRQSDRIWELRKKCGGKNGGNHSRIGAVCMWCGHDRSDR